MQTQTPEQTATPAAHARRLAFLANFSKGCPVIEYTDAADMARKSHRTGDLLQSIDRDCDRYHDRKDN